jgi:hypothetical protein
MSAAGTFREVPRLKTILLGFSELPSVTEPDAQTGYLIALKGRATLDRMIQPRA